MMESAMGIAKTTRRVKNRIVWIGAVLAIVGLGVSALYARTLASEDDDVTAVVRAYSSALHELERGNPTEQVRKQFYQIWLPTVFGACERLPPEDVPQFARLTCLSLANGAEDYELAEVIATNGSIYAPELQDRLTYWDQRVGLREVVAARTGNPQDSVLIGLTAQEALAAIRPTLDDTLYSRDAVSFLSVQRVFQVAARAAATETNPVGAALLMEESAAFAVSVPEFISQQVTFSWWADQSLQHAAHYWIEAGDVAAAIQALRKIDVVAVKRVPSGEHALICAGDAVPLGRFNENFARAWLDQADPWTSAEVRMAYALGFVLANKSPFPTSAELQEASSLLETILAMKPELSAADAAASAPILSSGGEHPQWMAEPVRSNALVTLAMTYRKLRLNDDAAVIAGMVIVDYPEHPSISAMESMLH